MAGVGNSNGMCEIPSLVLLVGQASTTHDAKFRLVAGSQW
jgi:hypothetical protein